MSGRVYDASISRRRIGTRHSQHVAGISARVVVRPGGSTVPACQGWWQRRCNAGVSHGRNGASRSHQVAVRCQRVGSVAVRSSASDQAAVRCQRVGSGSSTMPARRIRWQHSASVSDQVEVRCQRLEGLSARVVVGVSQAYRRGRCQCVGSAMPACRVRWPYDASVSRSRIDSSRNRGRVIASRVPSINRWKTSEPLLVHYPHQRTA